MSTDDKGQPERTAALDVSAWLDTVDPDEPAQQVEKTAALDVSQIPDGAMQPPPARPAQTGPPQQMEKTAALDLSQIPDGSLQPPPAQAPRPAQPPPQAEPPTAEMERTAALDVSQLPDAGPVVGVGPGSYPPPSELGFKGFDEVGENRESTVVSAVPREPWGLLQVESGPARRQQFTLIWDTVTIGRSRKSDVVIEDGALSRQHFRIDVEGQGGHVLTDLGSGNGTYVNGVRVNQAELDPGAVIKAGNSIMRFVVPGAEDAPTHRDGPASVNTPGTPVDKRQKPKITDRRLKKIDEGPVSGRHPRPTAPRPKGAGLPQPGPAAEAKIKGDRFKRPTAPPQGALQLPPGAAPGLASRAPGFDPADPAQAQAQATAASLPNPAGFVGPGGPAGGPAGGPMAPPKPKKKKKGKGGLIVILLVVLLLLGGGTWFVGEKVFGWWNLAGLAPVPEESAAGGEGEGGEEEGEGEEGEGGEGEGSAKASAICQEYVELTCKISPGEACDALKENAGMMPDEACKTAVDNMKKAGVGSGAADSEACKRFVELTCELQAANCDNAKKAVQMMSEDQCKKSAEGLELLKGAAAPGGEADAGGAKADAAADAGEAKAEGGADAGEAKADVGPEDAGEAQPDAGTEAKAADAAAETRAAAADAGPAADAGAAPAADAGAAPAADAGAPAADAGAPAADAGAPAADAGAPAADAGPGKDVPPADTKSARADLSEECAEYVKIACKGAKSCDAIVEQAKMMTRGKCRQAVKTISADPDGLSAKCREFVDFSCSVNPPVVCNSVKKAARTMSDRECDSARADLERKRKK